MAQLYNAEIQNLKYKPLIDVFKFPMNVYNPINPIPFADLSDNEWRDMIHLIWSDWQYRGKADPTKFLDQAKITDFTPITDYNEMKGWINFILFRAGRYFEETASKSLRESLRKLPPQDKPPISSQDATIEQLTSLQPPLLEQPKSLYETERSVQPRSLFSKTPRFVSSKIKPLKPDIDLEAEPVDVSPPFDIDEPDEKSPINMYDEIIRKYLSYLSLPIALKSKKRDILNVDEKSFMTELTNSIDAAPTEQIKKDKIKDILAKFDNELIKSQKSAIERSGFFEAIKKDYKSLIIKKSAPSKSTSLPSTPRRKLIEQVLPEHVLPEQVQRRRLSLNEPELVLKQIEAMTAPKTKPPSSKKKKKSNQGKVSIAMGRKRVTTKQILKHLSSKKTISSDKTKQLKIDIMQILRS